MRQIVAVFALLLLFVFNSTAAQSGFAATVHPLATDAALNALRQGGNAVDATVAAALTLGVVDGHNSGVGGGCFFLLRRANGELIAIDGRETAPAAASRDMYIRNGKADPALSQTGPLAAGIPGSVATYHYAVTHFGKLKWSEVILPAARLAENGFTLDASYAGRLRGAANEIKLFPAASAIFLNKEGQPWKRGEVLKQTDLAASYRALAEQGPDWFYKGPFATAAAGWMRANGGLITEDDFRNYKIQLREPIRTTYRGHEIVGFPPPSSGGVHVAQILNILEHFDLKSMGYNSPDFIHVVAEAMKLAFADRAYWLGDPDFVKVPRGLTSKEYAAGLAKLIQMSRTVPVPTHNTPANSLNDTFGKHTTHFTVADGEGNWVACTATINTTFGSKVVVPGTGVVLNNQMDDFSAQPGVANFFGLVGAEANAVAPGKRPLSSMSPTIVLKNGQPIFSAGAAGGPTIISQTLLAVIATIDFGMDPETALKQGRFHHQWKPDELRIERSISASTLKELEKRGHKVVPIDSLGACQAVGINLKTRALIGAHDPRVAGKAKGN